MPDKPRCKLIGEDGNVFNIIGLIKKTLKASGQPEKAKEFVNRAFAAGSYDEVLAMADNYVEIC
jgi:hypothetical protein